MDIKELLKDISGIFDQITDPKVRIAVTVLLNLVEKLVTENAEMRQKIQELKNELNRLKGEQGQPKINPQKKDGDVSSEKERKKGKGKKPKKPKQKKKGEIKPDRTVACFVDPNCLPEDAEHKGYKRTIIQDVKFITDNVEFKREVYYSKSLNKTFVAELPKGYQVEFGPGIRSLVLSLYHESNMTEPAIKRLLNSGGISISKSTISRMLTDKHEAFHQEKEDIVDAGLKGPYQQADDTSARENGKNRHVHIFCNPFYTAYFTREKKDRMTLIEILCRGELRFLLNPEAYELMEKLGVPEKRIVQLKALNHHEQMSRSEINAILLELFPNPKKQRTNRRRILESAALAYYQGLPHAVQHLMTDDAPQFTHLAQNHLLCWVHEGRHYKKLSPFIPLHQEKLNEFLDKFWDFYHELLIYKKEPTDGFSRKLEKTFDEIFSIQTGYDALDRRINLTRAKKERLLLPLKFPFLPVHNNDSENGAQHQARLRDIHLQTRNEKGTRAKDTFATIIKTARKLGVNLFDYLYDRVSESFSMPSLATLILGKYEILPNAP